MATCKDCIHEKACKNAYSFKVTPPNVCGSFKNKADVVEVVRLKEQIKRLQGEMDCLKTTYTQATINAYKTFAEKLSEKAVVNFWSDHSYVSNEDISDVLEELIRGL